MSSVIKPRPSMAGHAVDESDPWRYGWRYVHKVGPDGIEQFVQVPLRYEDLLHPEEEDFIVHTLGHDRDCHYLKDCFNYQVRHWPGYLTLSDHRIVWEVDGVAHGPDVVVLEQVTTTDVNVGTYRVGELGARPVLVVEVTSPENFRHDLFEKVREYWQARIPIYAIIDRCAGVDGQQLRILGYHWTPTGYTSISLDERDWLPLEPLQLWLGIDGDRVACYDTNGQRLQDGVDAMETAEAERTRAEKEKGRAEKEKARAEKEKARAEREKARAEQAQARAEKEKARADAALEAKRVSDARSQELEAEVRRLRGEQ